MRLGILGGTFDPVHYGHLRLAEIAREGDDDNGRLDKIIFVPAGDPWRKAGRDVSDPAHRAAMVRLAIAGNDAFELSTIELDRAGPSYTVETLEALHHQYQSAELLLIMGEDALADLPNWREPQRILELAKLGVASRSDSQPGRIEAAQEALPGLMSRLIWIGMEALEISSSGIRQCVQYDYSIRYLVPDAVIEYIREHGLYRD